MKWLFLACFLVSSLVADAQSSKSSRPSMIDADEDVVQLDEKRPLMLQVIKDAPVFSDRLGKHKLGTLLANQSVRLEAMTDKAYKVRGKGTNGGISGWVPPWAFQTKDPNFAENLKKLYQRQLEVQQLIAKHEVAVGMTPDEVSASKGKPTRMQTRKTGDGQAMRWEFIDYDEVKHYTTQQNPATGAIYRRLSHVTQEEKSRISVEFERGLVSAVEESEDKRRGSNVRIIVPPVVFGW